MRKQNYREKGLVALSWIFLVSRGFLIFKMVITLLNVALFACLLLAFSHLLSLPSGLSLSNEDAMLG